MARQAVNLTDERRVRLVWERNPRPERLGLVLSGGAARGIAHLGVLEVLEEHGIQPDCIAGSSAGALVGGLYAAGVSVADLIAEARHLNWRRLARVTMPGLGLFDISPMEERVNEILGGPVALDEVRIPFTAVAVDISTGELVAMNDGSLASAIRASCSAPGIFLPTRRKGRLLVDGGVVNNLPVSVAQRMGATYTIAVDLLPPNNVTHKEPKNLPELIIITLYMLMRSTHNEGPQADRVIMPRVGHIGLADLSAVDELLAAGRAAAQAMMPAIEEDLATRAGV